MKHPTLLNATLPLIVTEWIMLLLGLVFIISLETYFYNKFRKKIKKSLIDISIANIFSTVVGIPLANIMRYLVMQFLTLIMPLGLFPNKREYVWEALSPGKLPQLHLWEHFVILAFILAINFIVTVYTELWALQYLNKQDNKIELRRQSFIFNTYSYGLIVILVIIYEIIYLR